MNFFGRIVSVIFVATVFLIIRENIISQYGQLPHKYPIPAIIVLIFAWFAGKQYDKKVYISNIDPLTRIYNRRYVSEKFPRLINYSKRKKRSIATILVDVNDFKKINDTYGHEYGDLVLKKISQILQDSFEKKDLIARWGGDEFLIFTSFELETEVLNKISDFMSKLEKQSTMPDGLLSVSLGMAKYPSDASSLEKLVSKADATMYEFKSKYKIENNFDNL